MKENLHYIPRHVVNRKRFDDAAGEPLSWVVMRSLQTKSPVASVNPDGKHVISRKYGYEIAENLFCEFFMPMKESVSTLRGKRQIRTAPAVAGMFFVRDTLTHIRQLAASGMGFELKFVKGRQYQQPVVIGDAEMNSFIAALSNASEVRFFSPDDAALKGKVGHKVRIYQDNNVFEGHIISFRGSRRRWLRLSIEGFLVAEMDFDIDALQSTGKVIELLD